MHLKAIHSHVSRDQRFTLDKIDLLVDFRNDYYNL